MFLFLQSTPMKGHFTEEKGADGSVSIIFSLNEAVGALAESLKIFKVILIYISHLS